MVFGVLSRVLTAWLNFHMHMQVCVCVCVCPHTVMLVPVCTCMYVLYVLYCSYVHMDGRMIMYLWLYVGMYVSIVMMPLRGAMECGGVVLAIVVLPALPPVILQSVLVRGAGTPMFLYIHVFMMWRSVCSLHRSYVIICVLYGHGQWHILKLYPTCVDVKLSERAIDISRFGCGLNHRSLWTQLCIRHRRWPPQDLLPSSLMWKRDQSCKC